MRCKKPAKLVILIFFALFVINTAVMYVMFGINVFQPVNRGESREAAGQSDNDGMGANPGYNPEWGTGRRDGSYPYQSTGSGIDAGNAGVTGTMPDDTGNAATARRGDQWSPADYDTHSREDFYLTESQVSDLEKLDIRDKLTAVTIIAKVNGDEADKVYEMAADGVTYGELEEIENMLAKYLTSEEVESLKSIVEKGAKNNSGQEARPDIDYN